VVDVDNTENKYPVHFVFIRATVGNDRLISNLIKLAWRQKQPYPRAITYQRKFTRTGRSSLKQFH
jgi:hypothetical protein